MNTSERLPPSSRFWNSKKKGDEDDTPQRPAIVDRLLRSSPERQDHNPPQFKHFEQHVRENDVQLARFGILKMTSYYEGSLIGPSDARVPDEGASCLEMIFTYYASRRQGDVIDREKGLSFEEQAEANSTMDLPEMERFARDFFGGVFNRKELLWMFKQANEMSGISDDNVFTLHLEEFICLVCQMGMQLYRGRDVEGVVKGMRDRLNLNNPIEMRAKLRKLGRMDAGFGAWKSDELSKVTFYDPEVRAVLGDDARSWILPQHQLIELKEKMTASFPAMQLPEWLSFKGPYIAFAAPVNRMRKGKPVRFKITIRNRAARKFAIHGRVLDLPWIWIKQSAAGDGIAPGMDFTQQLYVEEVPPGHHLGAIVFSAKEGGPELFRCPIYLRGVQMSRAVLASDAHKTLARGLDVQAWRDKFKQHDIARTGSVSAANFQQVVQAVGVDIGEQEMRMLLADVDSAQGTVNYDDLLERMGEVVPDAAASAVLAKRAAAAGETKRAASSKAEWEDADAADGEEQTAGKGEAGPGRRSSSAERTGSQAGRTGSSAARTPSRAERTTSSASSHSRQTHEHRAEAAAAKGQQQHATNAAIAEGAEPKTAEEIASELEEAQRRARRQRLDAGKMDPVEQRVLKTGFAVALQVGVLPTGAEIDEEIEHSYSPDRSWAGDDSLSSVSLSRSTVSLSPSLSHSPLPRMV